MRGNKVWGSIRPAPPPGMSQIPIPEQDYSNTFKNKNIKKFMGSWDPYTIMLECIITRDASTYSIGYIVIYITYVLKYYRILMHYY